MTTPQDDLVGYPEDDVAVAAVRLARLLSEFSALIPEEVREVIEAQELALTGAARRLEHKAELARLRVRELEYGLRHHCARCRYLASNQPAWHWRKCECVVDCGASRCRSQ